MVAFGDDNGGGCGGGIEDEVACGKWEICSLRGRDNEDGSDWS